MAKPYDTLLVMVVAQKPFESNIDQFCKLIPFVYVDGERPKPGDFPNDNEIWWMLTAKSAALAEPGRLIVGSIEEAKRFNEQASGASWFQVVRESVSTLGRAHGMEVIDIPSDSIGSLHDIVSGSFHLDLQVRPTPAVMLRWRSDVFGPFSTTTMPQNEDSVLRRVSFAPLNSDRSVIILADTQFRSAAGKFRIEELTNVSTSSHRVSENHDLRMTRHELLLNRGYEKLFEVNPREIKLESDEQVLRRLAKQCLQRKKFQELRSHLEELKITAAEAGETEEVLQIVDRVRSNALNVDSALEEVAKSMLTAGLLGDDRIKRAEQSFAEAYVRDRAAVLQSQIEANLTGKRNEIRKAEGELVDLRSRMKREEENLREELNGRLLEEQEKARGHIAKEREEFEGQKAELQRQQDLLKKNLEKVTAELRNAGDEVVNRFLTIAPLLGLSGIGERKAETVLSEQSPRPEAEPAALHFEIPSFVLGGRGAVEKPLDEEEFFDRFRKVVEDSGFTYRELDLKAFHLSVLCGPITVLGGPSGTGKSSLPMLYAKALIGTSAESGRPDSLMINVNPSWMEVGDLIGHMNTLEGQFYPAESGLYQYLIYAQEEYQAHRTSSCVYMACLDEMNLSQVEHYFSDFMLVLEREGNMRCLKCFPPGIVRPSCPFKNWSTITLSPALRFVGTVNFDETTRLLSDRFLDRANLIRLGTGALPSVAKSGTSILPRAVGRMVTLSDYENWSTQQAIPGDLAELTDSLRQNLEQLGFPISPRVYRSICKFVASSHPLLAPAKAFDLQLAQRVIPRIRNLVTKRQLDALDALLKLLGESTICSFDESIPRLEDIREVARGRDWLTEE